MYSSARSDGADDAIVGDDAANVTDVGVETYYIDPINGNNDSPNNNGLSSDLAFQSLSKAMSIANTEPNKPFIFYL